MKTLFHSLITLFFLTCAACGNADESITIIDPQVMLAPPGISVTAGLMSLRNNTDSDIFIEKITADNFKRVELHKTEITDGTARMIEQKNLKIPANEILELSNGGYHLMLYAPDKGFAEGDIVSISLYTSAGKIEFTAPVKRLVLQHRKIPMTQNSHPVGDKLKSWPINILPHHLVSRLTYRLTRIESSLKNPVIRWFIKTFNVDMQDAIEQDITRFKNFNAFFTRELKPGARPVAEGPEVIASPVDGAVSQSGNIENGRIFQAKGHDYSLLELVGGNRELAETYQNGRFATLYLSPRDYHRIHMPCTGKLKAQTHVPGRLFSVAPHTVNTVSGLFARNERVVAHFDTEHGPLAMVLVGAINVAAIETVWSGLVTPPKGKKITEVIYTDEQQQTLKKGQEMGRFNMGSTVILLFGQSIRWDEKLVHGETVRMGERIASVSIDQ